VSSIASLLRRTVFEATGRRPWSRGYLEARDDQIRAALRATAAAGRFEPGAGYGRSLDERVVEFPWFLEKLPPGNLRLLDAGSTLNHEVVLDHLPLDRLRLFISTLAPEEHSYWKRGISYVYEDLRDLSFKDHYFDCVASLSTLEHVGMDNALYVPDAKFKEKARKDPLRVMAQFRRVLKPGGTLLVTVPYGREADHGWFQQFGREMLAELIASFGPARTDLRFFRYRPEGWKSASQEECDDASYFDIHKGQPLEPDRAAAARAVACVCLVSKASE
jgi:SAM-dependent methyltransferase